MFLWQGMTWDVGAGELLGGHGHLAQHTWWAPRHPISSKTERGTAPKVVLLPLHMPCSIVCTTLLHTNRNFTFSAVPTSYGEFIEAPRLQNESRNISKLMVFINSLLTFLPGSILPTLKCYIISNRNWQRGQELPFPSDLIWGFLYDSRVPHVKIGICLAVFVFE